MSRSLERRVLEAQVAERIAGGIVDVSDAELLLRKLYMMAAKASNEGNHREFRGYMKLIDQITKHEPKHPPVPSQHIHFHGAQQDAEPAAVDADRAELVSAFSRIGADVSFLAAIRTGPANSDRGASGFRGDDTSGESERDNEDTTGTVNGSANRADRRHGTQRNAGRTHRKRRRKSR